MADPSQDDVLRESLSADPMQLAAIGFILPSHLRQLQDPAYWLDLADGNFEQANELLNRYRSGLHREFGTGLEKLQKVKGTVSPADVVRAMEIGERGLAERAMAETIRHQELGGVGSALDDILDEMGQMGHEVPEEARGSLTKTQAASAEGRAVTGELLGQIEAAAPEGGVPPGGHIIKKLTPAEARWFSSFVGADLDDLIEAGISVEGDMVRISDLSKAYAFFDDVVTSQQRYGTHPEGMRPPPSIYSGTFLDRAEAVRPGPPPPPSRITPTGTRLELEPPAPPPPTEPPTAARGQVFETITRSTIGRIKQNLASAIVRGGSHLEDALQAISDGRQLVLEAPDHTFVGVTREEILRDFDVMGQQAYEGMNPEQRRAYGEFGYEEPMARPRSLGSHRATNAILEKAPWLADNTGAMTLLRDGDALMLESQAAQAAGDAARADTLATQAARKFQSLERVSGLSRGLRTAGTVINVATLPLMALEAWHIGSQIEEEGPGATLRQIAGGAESLGRFLLPGLRGPGTIRTEDLREDFIDREAHEIAVQNLGLRPGFSPQRLPAQGERRDTWDAAFAEARTEAGRRWRQGQQPPRTLDEEERRELAESVPVRDPMAEHRAMLESLPPLEDIPSGPQFDYGRVTEEEPGLPEIDLNLPPPLSPEAREQALLESFAGPVM